MKVEAIVDKRKGNMMPRASRKRERSVSRLREEMENLGVDMSNTGSVSFSYSFLHSLAENLLIC